MKHINLLIATVILLFFSQAVSACDPGQYDDAGTCINCPDNTFSPDGNGTQCDSCTNCVQCNAISGDCTECDAGF